MEGKPAADEADILVDLLSELGQAADGITFVYRVLEELQTSYGLKDAVVVVEEDTLGLQAFRLGHRPVTPDQLAQAVPNEIAVLPAGAVPARVRAAAGRLCAIALSMHVARHDAGHDPLTLLANRRTFDSALATALAQSERYGWRFSLVTMDLNQLKSVNDSAGHSRGDEVLRSFGECLRKSVRGGDTAARIGGDEFAVILGHTGPGEVGAFVERLRRLARDVPVGVEFSAGAASAPDETINSRELLRLADTRLYGDKTRNTADMRRP